MTRKATSPDSTLTLSPLAGVFDPQPFPATLKAFQFSRLSFVCSVSRVDECPPVFPCLSLYFAFLTGNNGNNGNSIVYKG
jgi:hypothetical protein